MWRTHRNRVDAGEGGTYSSTGYHRGKNMDPGMIIPAMMVNFKSIIDGRIDKNHLDNPYWRWHKLFELHPEHHSDVDDHALTIFDEYERFKKFKATDIEGLHSSTPLIPKKNDDEAL